jgi:hypothetical protein
MRKKIGWEGQVRKERREGEGKRRGEGKGRRGRAGGEGERRRKGEERGRGRGGEGGEERERERRVPLSLTFPSISLLAQHRNITIRYQSCPLSHPLIPTSVS